MRLLHGLAKFIRGSVRCMFPLATLGVWTGVLLVPQGTDVLRAALERLSRLHSVGDLLYMGVASVLLGLSLWYSMRWLIDAELPALRFTQPLSTFWRTWVPRIAGAFAPLLVGVVIAASGSFSQVEGLYRYGTAGAFAVLSALLLVFFWRRRHFVPSLRDADGRDQDGNPGVLALDQRLPPGTTGLIFWSILLSAMLGGLFVQFPLTVPRVVGAAAIAALALASINLFGSFVLTWLPMRRSMPPLGPWLVLWAILISPFTDNHGGRVLADVKTSPDAPQTIAEAYDKWSAGLPQGDTAPVYIVAAEGGGIRAAYWTAAVLQALDHTEGFRNHVFAISGVSGGSVGAAMWAASVRDAMCGGASGTRRPQATDMLAADLVSPALAGLFFYDFAQRFIPIPVDRLDRSQGLEEGMERAAYRLPGRPLERSISEFYLGCAHLPELLLNSTVVETGQRAVLSRLGSSEFANAFPWAATGETLSLSRQALSQFTHHSARFPVISPAGSIRALPPGEPDLWDWLVQRWWPPVRLRLADGGYFDNSGVQTALDVLEVIGPAAERSKRTVKLIVITSDPQVAAQCGTAAGDATCPTPQKPDPWHAPSVLHWLHETVPIVEALYLVRDSRLHITAAQAIRRFDQHVIMLPLPTGVKAPLGWALSEQVREDILCNTPGVLKARFPTAASSPRPSYCPNP